MILNHQPESTVSRVSPTVSRTRSEPPLSDRVPVPSPLRGRDTVRGFCWGRAERPTVSREKGHGQDPETDSPVALLGRLVITDA